GCSSLCFFFFQAEDGIRDLIVTGVQTCALPIFGWRRVPVDPAAPGPLARTVLPQVRQVFVGSGGPARLGRATPGDTADQEALERSEERRVGKEWRARGGAGR